MRALVLSIDLDGPEQYAAIHGLPSTTAPPDLMYQAPLRRFVELCQALGGPGTIFAIGRDLEREGAESLAALAGAGFEIADHSYAHDYRLTLQSPSDILADLRRSREVFARVVGAEPSGFRAPGHHLSPALLDALEVLGYRYSSSVLPSPAYFLVKLSVLTVLWLTSRSSRAILGSPALALAPRHPYRPARDPYRRGRRALLELPIAVATAARLPVTGACLVLAPALLRRAMLRSLGDQAVVVVNLHAMDLVEPESDGLPVALRRRQPELRIPLDERRRILWRALQELAASRQVMTCRQVAAAY